MPEIPIADRLNSAYHRILAHTLAQQGNVLAQARSVVDAWSYNNRYPPAFVSHWKALLDGPLSVLQRAIARRDLVGQQLRGSSPFALVPFPIWSKEQVERLWRFVACYAMRTVEHFEYPLYAEHLKRLSRQDRMLRFSRIVDDDWIEKFATGLAGDPSTIILGHFDRSLRLDGAIQISLVDREGVRYADFGLSVLEEARHRGIGHHLFERGLLWAQTNGAVRIWSFCSANNVEVHHLGKRHAISTSLLNGSFEAVLGASPLTIRTLANDILAEFTGEWDYETKAHRVAFSMTAGNGSKHFLKEREFIRLVKIATMGRTDVLAAYIILFRFALARYTSDPGELSDLLGKIKDILMPLVAHDPDLHTYVEGLPSRYDIAKLAANAAGIDAHS